MSRFIEIDGEKVPVSEEVYKAYMQPIWREQKRIQRAYEDLNGMDDPFVGSGKILKQSSAGNGTGSHHLKMGLPLKSKGTVLFDFIKVNQKGRFFLKSLGKSLVTVLFDFIKLRDKFKNHA